MHDSSIQTETGVQLLECIVVRSIRFTKIDSME
jgi:hypothetical protein